MTVFIGQNLQEFSDRFKINQNIAKHIWQRLNGKRVMSVLNVISKNHKQEKTFHALEISTIIKNLPLQTYCSTR